MTLSSNVKSDALTPSIDRAEALRRFNGADKLLLVGCVFIGTFIFGPIGLVIVIVALWRFRSLTRAGFDFRPWAVTLIGAFCLVDAGCNMLGWALDLFLHDSLLGATFTVNWGKTFDSAYVYGFNQGGMGGVLLPAEKAMEAVAVFVLFPMRIAAAYAFLKMKRWGFQYMIVTSWMYVFFWVGYMVQFTMYFEERMGNATYGMLGWWAEAIPFITPFVMLPWLYSVNRDAWSE